MLPLILLGVALAVLASSSKSKTSAGTPSNAITYVDQKKVTWRIWNEGPWWTISTSGYGGRFPNVPGYVSLEQAKENIEGNAAGRDPATGNILPGALNAK